MKLSTVLSLALVGSAAAFAPSSTQQRPTFGVRYMSEEPVGSTGALVPIKEETVEFTAGLLGGVAGFAVGGPVLGAIGAAAANYVSKSEGEVSEVITAVSKSSIQVYNYLAKLDSKYEVLSKAQTSLEDSLGKLKATANVDPETVEKVETALASTKSKITEINDEYDLVGAGTTAFGVVGDLVEKAIQKAGELNEEYKLTDKALEALSGAVDKAKTAAQKSA
eukprot:CAMPEP_0202458752 /NCGR_PEP_ID=MMETSP1360-20130828/27768_1 /ASSEMBLY_ACC=CAM_ASM_000848 /TAXON_ID=515479 /ORGANISM="Licmophora paradoxa, Strain CCMP2313" /LENGTH=221 /DNA_ID=CAMNT_0049079453 /DNA_START=62 /DNA_END=727 /DNA_ORIENTATION=+